MFVVCVSGSRRYLLLYCLIVLFVVFCYLAFIVVFSFFVLFEEGWEFV